MRVEGVVLEDHGDVPLTGGKILNRLTSDEDAAGGQCLEPRDEAQDRGLPAPGGSDKNQKLPVGNLQIERTDRLGPIKALYETFKRDLGHKDGSKRREKSRPRWGSDVTPTPRDSDSYFEDIPRRVQAGGRPLRLLLSV
jgi:hypothetical protein